MIALTNEHSPSSPGQFTHSLARTAGQATLVKIIAASTSGCRGFLLAASPLNSPRPPSPGRGIA